MGRKAKTQDQYVAEVQAIHEGRIEVLGTYVSNKVRILHRCLIDGHEWSARPTDVISGSGCKICFSKRLSQQAGILRKPRASEAEKQRARDMRSEGLTYMQIAKALNRSYFAVLCWCDPKTLKRQRVVNAKWYKNNKERSQANNKRYTGEYLHGRVMKSSRRAAIRGNYREYDETTGELKYEEWEPYLCFGHSAEDEHKLLQLERRLRDLNKRQKGGVKWSLEHLLPLSMGGTHNWWNLAIRPLKDNMSKGASYHEADLDLRRKNIVELFNEG